MSKKVNGPRPEPTDELATLRRRLEEATAALKSRDEQIDAQAKIIEGCTDEIASLQGTIQNLKAGIGSLRDAPPTHVVRSFEAGAKAERKRALEQARISSLQWGGNTEVRRALDTFVAELKDERRPLPGYKPEGA